MRLIMVGGGIIVVEVSSITNPKHTVQFCVRCTYAKLNELTNGTPIIKQHAIISLKNIRNNKFVIHPLTSFIFSNWKHRAYNTQRHHANNVVSFLNFLLVHPKVKINSFSQLTFEHASLFLNFLTKESRSRSTIKGIQRTLTLFYEYLAKKQLLLAVTPDQFDRRSNPHDPYKTYTTSPFKGIILPGRDLPHQAHMLPEEYIIPFIETAVRVANPIALGIYFQCFGGIRVGGLVNIRRDDVASIGAYGAHGMIIKLQKK